MVNYAPLTFRDPAGTVWTVGDPRYSAGGPVALASDPVHSTYNVSADNTRNWRTGLARTRYGTGSVTLFTRGDSTSEYGQSGSPAAWWEHMALMLAGRLSLPVRRIGAAGSGSAILYDGLGVSGTTQPTSLGVDVNANAVDVLIVAYGINDLLLKVPVATYKSNLITFVNNARAQRANMDIWLRAMPPVVPPVDAVAPQADYQTAMLEAAVTLGIPVVRIDNRWGTDPAKAQSLGLQGGDGIHPTGVGKWEQGQAFAAAFASLG